MVTESTKTNREHSFDFELASIVGIEKAILLKNISHWCVENQRRNLDGCFDNGIWWTEESLSSLAKKYPYMRRSNISRWINELFENGWIRIQQNDGGKNRYSTGIVFIVWNTDGDWQAELSHFETVKSRPKMGQKPSQNGTISVPKWDNKRPKMGHNNIELNIESNVELDVENSAAAPLFGPFKKVGEIEVETISLETPKKEKPSPGAGPGVIRVSIADPELPGVRIEEEIKPKTEPEKTGRSKAKNPRNGTTDEIDLAARVIEHLNQAAGRSFRINAGENAKGIIARHRDGFTEEELKQVIDFKVKAWGNDREMCEHINPVTLFRPSNFERYLQAAKATPKAQPTTRSSIQTFAGSNYNEKQAF